MESLGAGSNTVPVIDMAMFLKQYKNNWSSEHSAFLLTSLPLQPCGNTNPVMCRNEYDEKGIESIAAKVVHDT